MCGGGWEGDLQEDEGSEDSEEEEVERAQQPVVVHHAVPVRIAQQDAEQTVAAAARKRTPASG